jgi:TPP-dependent indolepyruvate ferredoxin oxidoreductase alpha subunit
MRKGVCACHHYIRHGRQHNICRSIFYAAPILVLVVTNWQAACTGGQLQLTHLSSRRRASDRALRALLVAE